MSNFHCMWSNSLSMAVLSTVVLRQWGFMLVLEVLKIYKLLTLAKFNSVLFKK